VTGNGTEANLINQEIDLLCSDVILIAMLCSQRGVLFFLATAMHDNVLEPEWLRNPSVVGKMSPMKTVQPLNMATSIQPSIRRL